MERTTAEHLEAYGFTWIEEKSHPCAKYWKRKRIAIDLEANRLYLMKFKDGDDYADLTLPDTFDKVLSLISLMTGEFVKHVAFIR